MGGNFFLYVSYQQERALYYLLKINKHSHVEKAEKKSKTSLVHCDLNHTLACHIVYDLAPLPVLDPIFLYLRIIVDHHNYPVLHIYI